MSISIQSVLVADPVAEECTQLLRENGIQVTCRYRMTLPELLQEIKNHDALIVRSETRVTAEVMAASPRLRAIGRAGTGVDNIDLDAATRKGIIVLNTPGGNSISACELTCALIMDLSRNISPAAASMKQGRWDRKLYAGSELYGKTLAVLGLGRIGKEVAARMNAFGMKVLGFDPIVTAEQASGFNVIKQELEEIWPQADYITVHTPLIPQTRNLINDVVLSKCKKSVKIVNVARGGIINEEDLLKALEDGRCGGAALDVYIDEPPKDGSISYQLALHPKVIATPHLGASTAEAQLRVAVEVAEQFLGLSGNNHYTVHGAVNAPVIAASLVGRNTPWIALATALGRHATAASVVSMPPKKVTVQLQGKEIEGMAFLSTAALLGLLYNDRQNGLNLINAPALALESGVKIEVVRHELAEGVQPRIKITLADVKSEYSLIGTVNGDGHPCLVAVNDSWFPNGGVALPENLPLQLHRFTTADLDTAIPSILGKMNDQSIRVTGIAMASGPSEVWCAVSVAPSNHF